MKTLIVLLFLIPCTFICSAQALTIDQKVAIANSVTFQDRIIGVIFEKAQYWRNFETPNRSDVNQQNQKRKRFSKLLLNSSNHADNIKYSLTQFWLTLYSTSSPVLDGGGLPTSTEISNSFDPTYDYFAGVVAGDESQTEIEW